MTLRISVNNRIDFRKAAFTLVEMLVVLGIITLLIGILLPAVLRAFAAAERARVSADLLSISTALEAYRADFSDYPRAIAPASGSGIGSELLVKALIAPLDSAADGADGPGFRAHGTSGRVYGPYINTDKFKFTASSPFQLLDRDGNAVLYFPARPVRPNVSVAGQYVGSSSAALYDSRYGDDKLSLQAMRYLLGDHDNDGAVSGSEAPIFTGPFILWTSGADGAYGISSFTPSAANSCDDVTNFR